MEDRQIGEHAIADHREDVGGLEKDVRAHVLAVHFEKAPLRQRGLLLVRYPAPTVGAVLPPPSSRRKALFRGIKGPARARLTRPPLPRHSLWRVPQSRCVNPAIPSRITAKGFTDDGFAH